MVSTMRARRSRRFSFLAAFLVELPGGAGSAPRLKAAKKENLLERRARIVETISRHLQKTRRLQSRR